MKTILYFQSSLAASNMRELEGVRKYAADEGWKVQVIEYDGAAKSRYETAGGILPDVKGLVSLYRPNGCIVECGGRRPKFEKEEFGRVPVVLLDCHPDDAWRGALCVYMDDETIGRTAARELLQLGFCDYAYIPWSEMRLTWNRVREATFRACVREDGKKIHLFRHTSQKMDKVRLFGEMSAWMRRLPRPCGVFAANDLMAQIFVEAAVCSGFGVPKDFAVVGIDNDNALCAGGAVSITSIEATSLKTGQFAAELLGRRMEHGAAGLRSIPVRDHHLFRRASTRLCKNADARVLRALEFIRRNACDGIAPPDVVAEMGCSRRLADLRFREATGHSILNEIHAVRIEVVKDMLRKGSFTMPFIADRTGYSSVVDLRRVFKRVVGKTMRGYVRSLLP